MDGDPLRRVSLPDYLFQLGVGDVVHRGKVAVQKTQPKILILNVERLTQPLRHLIDETERALAAAAPEIHRLEHDLQAAHRFPGYDYLVYPAVSALDLQVYRASLRGVIKKVQLVAGVLSRYLDYPVSNFQ